MQKNGKAEGSTSEKKWQTDSLENQPGGPLLRVLIGEAHLAIAHSFWKKGKYKKS